MYRDMEIERYIIITHPSMQSYHPHISFKTKQALFLTYFSMHSFHRTLISTIFYIVKNLLLVIFPLYFRRFYTYIWCQLFIIYLFLNSYHSMTVKSALPTMSQKNLIQYIYIYISFKVIYIGRKRKWSILSSKKAIKFISILTFGNNLNNFIGCWIFLTRLP